MSAHTSGRGSGWENFFPSETEALRAENTKLRESFLEEKEAAALAVGMEWYVDSTLEKWFPLTAERLQALESENAKLREINADLLEALKGRNWLTNHEIEAIIAKAEGRE